MCPVLSISSVIESMTLVYRACVSICIALALYVMLCVRDTQAGRRAESEAAGQFRGMGIGYGYVGLLVDWL